MLKSPIKADKSTRIIDTVIIHTIKQFKIKLGKIHMADTAAAIREYRFVQMNL